MTKKGYTMELLKEALDLSEEQVKSIKTFSLTREKSGLWNIILYGDKKINNTKISFEDMDWDYITELAVTLDSYLLAHVKVTKKAKQVSLTKTTVMDKKTDIGDLL